MSRQIHLSERLAWKVLQKIEHSLNVLPLQNCQIIVVNFIIFGTWMPQRELLFLQKSRHRLTLEKKLIIPPEGLRTPVAVQKTVSFSKNARPALGIFRVG